MIVNLLFQLYEIDDDDEAIPRLTLSVPRDLKDGFINNKKENYKFRYMCDRTPPPSLNTHRRVLQFFITTILYIQCQ